MLYFITSLDDKSSLLFSSQLLHLRITNQTGPETIFHWSLWFCLFFKPYGNIFFAVKNIICEITVGQICNNVPGFLRQNTN